MSKATPRPWAVNHTRVESRDEHGVANDGWIVADCKYGPDGEANAELIVCAVNCHDELVEFLRSVVRGEFAGCPPQSVLVSEAKSLLAKAEGK